MKPIQITQTILAIQVPAENNWGENLEEFIDFLEEHNIDYESARDSSLIIKDDYIEATVYPGNWIIKDTTKLSISEDWRHISLFILSDPVFKNLYRNE